MKQIKQGNLLSAVMFILWSAYFAIIYSYGNLHFSWQTSFSFGLLAVCLVERLLSAKSNSRLSVHLNNLTFWYGLFYAWVCLAYLWTSAVARNGTNFSRELLRPLVAFMAMDLYVWNKERADKLAKAFCLGMFFFSAMVLVVSPFATYGSLLFGRRLNQHRNTIGYALFFAAIISVYLYMEYKNKVWLVIGALCAVVSVLSGSRKIIFAYGIGIVMLLFAERDIKKGIKQTLIFILILGISIPLLYQIPFIKETFGERLLAVVDDSIEDSSVMFRNVAKKAAIKVFLDSPIIGQGWAAVINSFRYKGVSIYAHNNYLEVLADFGIVGAVLLFWRSLIWGIKSFLGMRRNKVYAIIAVLFMGLILLDWGQVTYRNIFMLCPWGIVYKLYCGKYYWQTERK